MSNHQLLTNSFSVSLRKRKTSHVMHTGIRFAESKKVARKVLFGMKKLANACLYTNARSSAHTDRILTLENLAYVSIKMWSMSFTAVRQKRKKNLKRSAVTVRAKRSAQNIHLNVVALVHTMMRMHACA